MDGLTYHLINAEILTGRVDALAIGPDSCMLRLEGGGTRLLPYTRIVTIGAY